MTDAELKAIKARHEGRHTLPNNDSVMSYDQARYRLGWAETDRAALLAEVEQLTDCIGAVERTKYAAEARLTRLLEWLDNNTTFSDGGKPVLAAVSRRIWYHATDDTESYPFSEVANAALIKEARSDD